MQKVRHLLENCLSNYKEYETNFLLLSICKPNPIQLLLSYIAPVTALIQQFAYGCTMHIHMLKYNRNCQ